MERLLKINEVSEILHCMKWGVMQRKEGEAKDSGIV